MFTVADKICVRHAADPRFAVMGLRSGCARPVRGPACVTTIDAESAAIFARRSGPHLEIPQRDRQERKCVRMGRRAQNVGRAAVELSAFTASSDMTAWRVEAPAGVLTASGNALA